jgi:oligopeptide transport system substrate-binding protein
MTNFLRTGVAIAAALFFAATAEGWAAVLHRGTNTEPRSLDPHLAAGNSAAVILYDLFTGLMTLDAAGKVVPGVADSFSVSDDGLVYTFAIRDNALWSDGTPLTAGDFVYSFRRLLAPETAARFASQLYPIANEAAVNRGQMEPAALGVNALDDKTLEVTLAQPTAYLPQLMAANAASPVPRHVIEAEGRGWTRPGVMVSNGAYVLAEQVPATFIRASKNDLFYDAGNVAIDEVIYYPTENQGTSLSRFRAGELDVILNFPADQVERIRETMPDALHITPALGVYYLAPNHARPPFDDARVRRALSLAIDREAIAARLLPPGTVPATNLVPPVTDGYGGTPADFGGKPLSERMAEARALLMEAGFGPDNPLTFSFKTDPIEQNRRIAVALTSMWKAIGANPDVETTGASDVNRDGRTGNFDIIRWTWFGPFDDAATFLGLMDSANGANVTGYVNPDFDAKLRHANATRDPEVRAQLLADAEAILNADHPAIPLYFHAGRRLVSPAVVGWIDNPRSANLSRYLSLAR